MPSAGRAIKAIVCLIGGSLIALPALADWDGRYMLTPQSDCSSTAPDGFLTINNGMLTGTESACRMTNQIDIRGMDGALFDMICTSDAGAWQERAIVMRGNDEELILVWNGFAFAYPACPVPPMRPRPRPIVGSN